MRNRKRASQRRRELTPDTDPRDLEYFNELVGRDIERFHELVASGRLVDILTNVAGLADARRDRATERDQPTLAARALMPPLRVSLADEAAHEVHVVVPAPFCCVPP